MRIEAMVLGLYEAIANKDWKAMQTADREVAAILSTLGAEGDVSATLPELHQLQELRTAHRQAQEHCASELEKLGIQLKEMGEHKEGWIAYAMNGNLEEAST